MLDTFRGVKCHSFYRRTTQRVRLKGLKRCKTGRKVCYVSKSAKTCIHCRYNKCLSIGMSPNLLQGKRVKQCPTEAETGDKFGEVPMENHCETVTRSRDRDCHSQQRTLQSTGKVQSEATRHSSDLKAFWRIMKPETKWIKFLLHKLATITTDTGLSSCLSQRYVSRLKRTTLLLIWNPNTPQPAGKVSH